MKLAALHLREMILSDMDMDKRLITRNGSRICSATARTLDQFVTSSGQARSNYLFSAEYNVVRIRSLLKGQKQEGTRSWSIAGV